MLGHIGARGTAYWNVRLLDHLFGFDEIRVHSRRPESRDAFARAALAGSRQAGARPSRPGGTASRAPTSWWRRRGSRRPSRCLKTEWIKRSAFVVPYGTMSAVELSLTDIMDKIVVDDWGQCKQGQFGSLRRHVETGRLSEATLHAELVRDRRRQEAGPRERRRRRSSSGTAACRSATSRSATRCSEGGAPRHRHAAPLRLTPTSEEAVRPRVGNQALATAG